MSTEASSAQPLVSSLLPSGMLFADRYELLAQIGEGATGRVYEARRLEDGARVALKVIHAELAGNRQVSKRFGREEAVLRRLKGPHLVEVHDLGEWRGLLYLALEFISGVPLDQLQRTHGELPIASVVVILTAVCEALETAHDAGVIHRDLKSANVLVDLQDGQVRDVHVLDFGMSKIMQRSSPGPESTNLTEQKMILGTPEYMSPEQARGDELDARCDVYSAGVILYELLSGHVPFQGRTMLSVISAHMTEPPPPLLKRKSGEAIPAALAAVAMHALAKRRSERYQSARNMADALRAADGSPQDVASVHPGPLERDSLPFRDTDHAVPPRVRVLDPPSAAVEKAPKGRVNIWLLIAIGSMLAGLVAGVLVALRC